MNRRGHLSHKVPNVKLRPAPRRSARRAASPPSALDDEIVNNAWRDAEESSAGPSGHGDKPWRGITVTFTGVQDKPALMRLVLELGGRVEHALTAQVTHVIAQGYGSPKYAFAVENRIPVLSPSWIHDAHSKWINGDELDVRASVESHKLQAFVGLTISVTGIDNMKRRKRLIQLIQDNGGVYSKDLTKDCTHLVSAFALTDPESKKSEKIMWALRAQSERDVGRRRGRKYEDEDMRVVYEAWLWDCIAYKGRWPEDAYDASQPRKEGRVDPETIMDGSVFQELEQLPQPQADETEDQPIAVRKRKREDMEALVGNLLSTSTPDIMVVNIDSEEAGPVTEEPKAAEELPRRPGAFDRKPSLLHASRSTAFSAPPTKPSAVLVDNSSGVEAKTSTIPAAGPSEQFFAGLRFSLYIKEPYHGLQEALINFGGEIVTEEARAAGAHVDYVVVRFTERPDMPEEEARAKCVTESWVETCCFYRRFFPPEEKIVFKPLTVPTPIPDVDTLFVHVAGFRSEDGLHQRRILRAVGGVLSEKLRRRSTHLVCPEPSGIKYETALQWGVAAVKPSWLLEVARTGRIVDLGPHLHNPSQDLSKLGERTASTSTTTTSTGSIVASLPAPGNSIPPSLSSSRMLKLTPTHINDDQREETPLTPKRETERVLNSATESPRLVASISVAAPGSQKGTPDAKHVGNAAGNVVPSTGGPTGGPAGGPNDMTAALRRLAESDAGPRTKLTRRPRASRPKVDGGGGSTTSLMLSTSASPMRPDLPAAAAAAAAAAAVEDESMRVTYADPVSEKERKRLLDAVMRGTSPKRSRV